MNPRQRRGVMLLALAAAGAVAVFALVASYTADVRANLEPETTVVRLVRAATALQPITPEMVEVRRVPQKWSAPHALRDPAQIAAGVAATDLPAGVELQSGMLVAPPTIEPGEREISILISADTGVAGKVAPGDVVDIQATFPGDNESLPRSRTIVSAARVVTVGGEREGGFAGGEDGAQQPATVVPVTFALPPRQALVLTYAESFATEVRLALLRPGDPSAGRGRGREYTLPPSKRSPVP
jgi:pilus assembly protein CpaB